MIWKQDKSGAVLTMQCDNNSKENFTKDLKAIVFIIIVLILTAISAYPQQRFNGQVVQVIDGRTFVIQMPNIKITGVLQYIEVPESEQPLHQTVKEHLEKLILNQTVEFQARVLFKDKTVGQLYVNGTDVSLQMLRDGAAWYSIPEKSGHDAKESAMYQNNELQAKNEKRGIWGVENLKPAWDFRAEKEEAERLQQEKSARENYAKRSFAEEMELKRGQLSGQQTAPQAEMWADVGADPMQNAFVGGLRAGYFASLRLGYVSTSSFFVDLGGNDFLRKVESRAFYFYKGDQTSIENQIYLIAFLSKSKEYKFLKSNSVVILADNQKIALPLWKRYPRNNYSSVSELLFYKISRSQLVKMSKAKNISVKLGSFSGGVIDNSMGYLDNLLNSSN